MVMGMEQGRNESAFRASTKGPLSLANNCARAQNRQPGNVFISVPYFVRWCRNYAR